MTKLLLFDAFNGVSGDMILGSLIDLGVPMDHLEGQLSLLELGGYSLEASPIKRNDVMGVNFKVRLEDTQEPRSDSVQGPAHVHSHDHDQDHDHDHHHHDHHHEHDHDHDHHHHDHHHEHDPSARDHVHDAAGDHGHAHGSFSEIRAMIERSGLPKRVKERSIAIFERLAQAESHAHGTSIEQVHFHEVGAVDSIVDIVGACIGFDYLGIDEFYASAINLGGGTVSFSHGTWPVPAPATAELLKGFPVEYSEIQAELTTPTGAAIVATLVDSERLTPKFRMGAAGLGAGDRELPSIPNMLRLVVGERFEGGETVAPPGVGSERVVLLEANIDDMDAEMFGHFMDVALENGALDVFFAPIQMKKNRPGHLLTVLCRPEDRERFTDLVFAETTTLGLRCRELDRFVLARESVVVETVFGSLRCKVSRKGGRVVDVSPEYDDLSRLARSAGVPMREVRRKTWGQIAELDIWERSST